MGKIRSGLRGWCQGVAESAFRRANGLMTSVKQSPFPRRVPRSHSFMATDLTEQESEGFLMLLFGAIFAGIIAARLGILRQFLVGLVVGGAVMAAWEQMMERRSRQRQAIAANVAFPASKGYEGYERVEWLNRLLKKKAWPYVVLATEDARPSIRDWLEPLLEEYRLGMYQVIREQPDVQRVEKYFPAEEVITCLHVDAISLGTTPPTIQGFKIQQLEEGKIICNVRMEWQSDAHITLGVGTVTGIVPVMLKIMKILLTVRVVIQITESAPFVAAIVATIPGERKPILDFSLSAVKSSTTVPKVVTKHLHNLVTNFILDTFLWPHRLVLPIIPPTKGLDLNELYPRLHGQLSVAVINGENLVNLYPYVTIYCRPKFKVRTKSIENTHDPTWNDEFTLDVEDQRTQNVIFQVMNENKGDDEHLGTVAYPLKDLALDQDVPLRLDVQPRKKKKSHDGGEEGEKKTYGSLTVELRYHVYTDLEREAAMKDEEKLIKALATPDEPGSYTTAVDLIHPY